jgi:hypothetical protein
MIRQRDEGNSINDLLLSSNFDFRTNGSSAESSGHQLDGYHRGKVHFFPMGARTYRNEKIPK